MLKLCMIMANFFLFFLSFSLNFCTAGFSHTGVPPAKIIAIYVPSVMDSTNYSGVFQKLTTRVRQVVDSLEYFYLTTQDKAQWMVDMHVDNRYQWSTDIQDCRGLLGPAPAYLGSYKISCPLALANPKIPPVSVENENLELTITVDIIQLSDKKILAHLPRIKGNTYYKMVGSDEEIIGLNGAFHSLRYDEGVENGIYAGLEPIIQEILKHLNRLYLNPT